MKHVVFNQCQKSTKIAECCFHHDLIWHSVFGRGLSVGKNMKFFSCVGMLKAENAKVLLTFLTWLDVLFQTSLSIVLQSFLGCFLQLLSPFDRLCGFESLSFSFWGPNSRKSQKCSKFSQISVSKSVFSQTTNLFSCCYSSLNQQLLFLDGCYEMFHQDICHSKNWRSTFSENYTLI